MLISLSRVIFPVLQVVHLESHASFSWLASLVLVSHAGRSRVGSHSLSKVVSLESRAGLSWLASHAGRSRIVSRFLKGGLSGV